jgi:hypothetical protein
MEYLVIVGFVAVIVIPMVLIFYTWAGRTEDEIISSQVQKISLEVSDAAEAMLHTKEGLDHIVIYTPIPVQGSLDTHSGYHNINIRSRGSYVEITD